MRINRDLSGYVEALFTLYANAGILESSLDELKDVCGEIVNIDIAPVYGAEFSHFASIVNFIKADTIASTQDKDYQFWLDRLDLAKDNYKFDNASLQDLLIILITHRMSLGSISFTHAMMENLYNRGKLDKKSFTSVMKDNMFVSIEKKVLISFALPKGFMTIKDIIGENVYEQCHELKRPILDELRYQLSVYHQSNPKTDDSLRTGATLDTIRLMKYGYEGFYETYKYRPGTGSNSF